MKPKRHTHSLGWITASLLILGLLLAGCSQTSGKDLDLTDFEALHAPAGDDANTYLVFGNIPAAPPALGLSAQLAPFLGRWEGYDYSPPVQKDYKIVLVVQEITAQEGRAYLWLGTNLQYPSVVQEIQFTVIPGTSPAIEFRARFGKETLTIRLVYDAGQQTLKNPDHNYRQLELRQEQSFYVYKDYSQYLAGKRISSQVYQNDDLLKYGKGYLLYLPEGYEDDPAKTWPLILFLHGSGDCGDNEYLLAKASPFMMIREQGPLPFIIVAPLMKIAKFFPLEYLEGVLAEAQTAYRVDASRIYVTGLSLGGEAAYRLAIHRPETFAAIAPLSAFLYKDEMAELERIKSLPVWAIHGENDTIVPLAEGRKPADALAALGGDIQFTILEGGDHDTWTGTYRDPAFYDWLLQHHLP